MMRRAQALIAAVLIFASMPARADLYMFTYEYYNDSAFTEFIGSAHTNCHGSCGYGDCGYIAPYRIYEKFNCNTQEQLFRACQAWNGSSWQGMTCPY
jgi:hypothetical protein